MDNYFPVTNANQLNKIFDNAQDKLIVVMFYTKNNPNCRKAKQAFEKSAMNHITSYFCIVDVDKFEGESRFANPNNINNMPKFDCYYMGNQFGNFVSSDEKEIETNIRSGEQYVMTQNNNKNNQGQNLSMGNMLGQSSQINPMQIQQIKQNIINNAMMQNPALAQQLVQNPILLDNYVQNQIQLMQRQQYFQQQQFSQPIMPQIPQMPGVINSNMPNLINPIISTSNITNPTANTDNLTILPTFQQMQQMFKIFQMMQNMGILKTSDKINEPVTQPPSETKPPTLEHDIIILPTGEKIIPLANGKYGLIKKPG